MLELNPQFPGPLVLVDVALRGALIALLVVLATVMRRDRPHLAAARVGVAMVLGLCAQVISATPLFEDMVPRLWQAPWVAVSVANAVLFWVFVQALFDDEFALRPVHGVAWLLTALLSGLNCAALANSASIVAPVTMGVQRAVPLVFAVMAALAAARHWRNDLVEERRRLRIFVVVTGVVYSLAMLGARLGSPQGRLMGLSATLDVLALLFIATVLVARLLRLGNSNLFPATTPAAVVHQGGTSESPSASVPAPDTTETTDNLLPPPDPAEERLAQALQHLMTVEHAYRAEDMSLASLAARLKAPEYKLRRLINQRMGYRNFNAFINGLRLDAVQAALRDPARRDLPVLTLALDAGFQSIGPFNRAFKVATGLTPTEFRRTNQGPAQQNSADS
ncbi:MAG: AraC family transcriptional regulator [Pseudomonadota bacterium]